MQAEIYQMKPTEENRGKIFFDYNKKDIDINQYDLNATIDINEYDEKDIDSILEGIFQYGNTDPMYYNDNPKARSISVSDIIKINDRYYFVQAMGFEDITEDITDKINESKELKEADEDIEPELDIDEIEEKSIYDLLVDREGVDITVGEFNTILQSIFAKYNKIYLTYNEFYNQDPDEDQQITEWDDEDEYTITYRIKDQIEPTIEIIDVEVL